MLRNPRYLLLAIISAVVMGILYVVTQVIFIVQNIDLWFSVISPINLTLFIIFTTLFGISLSYQVWVRKQPQVCDIRKSGSGASMSGGGTLFTFLVVQCPACASIGALFLPVSVIGFFTQYNSLITLLTIGLLLFTLRYLGAFKK